MTATPLGDAPDLVRVRRALLSVSDKSGLVEFAKSLASHGVELVSTGGTARVLGEAGLSVRTVEDLTGFPEMMDGRVKTLHPAVHGGLLGRRDLAAHVESMKAHGIEPIDLVAIDLYPFERTIARAECSEAEAIEQIDIGGPAMVRSASKNHDFVTVVTSTRQYDEVLATLAEHGGRSTLALRRRLAADAFARTASYDSVIAGWMARWRSPAAPASTAQASTAQGGSPATPRLEGPHSTTWSFRSLRYGENPHQIGAVAATPGGPRPSVAAAEPLHGKELSYNNLLDAAAALELVQDLTATFGQEPCAAIVKHTNPCGAAVGASLAQAFAAAHAGDPVAAYGGILALSNEVDEATAQAIVEGDKFLEVIVAPTFSRAALDLLAARWKNVRLLPVGPISPPAPEIHYRSIPGGVLAQERDIERPRTEAWSHVAGPAPDEATRRSAAFAVVVAKHLKSNAVCIVRGATLLGAGAGQMDRVASCRIAVEKASARLAPGAANGGPDPVAAGDAFFPFSDGPKVLIDAGVRCLVHPGGSKRDGETLALCEQSGVTCLVTGVRQFRH